MMTTTRKMTAMVWVTMTDDDIMLWRTIVMILTTMMSMSLTVIMMVRTVLVMIITALKRRKRRGY